MEIEFHCYSCGEKVDLKVDDPKICLCGSEEIYAV